MEFSYLEKSRGLSAEINIIESCNISCMVLSEEDDERYSMHFWKSVDCG